MKRMLISLLLLSSATAVFADTYDNISIQGQLTSTVPIANVNVHILSAGAVVGTASDISLVPDVDGLFSTQTYITNPWVFRTGSDYTMRLSTGGYIISTFSITAVPFALTVRGDAQTGNQNIFGAYGNIGIGTGAPLYRLEISSAAGSSEDIVVISTGSSAVIRMTGAGIIRANKYYGDGSSLTGITASGDNLGNHTATQNLNMAKFDITNASTATFTGYINVTSTAGYQQGGATILTSPGYSDLFLGYQAGYSDYVGANYNTMVGFLAGNRDFTGSFNSFVGALAGFSNTGENNSFVGTESGYSNTSGARNSFFGSGAGKTNTDTHDNTYLGYFSGSLNLNANSNTYVGSYAGANGWDANNNSFLGYQAGYSTNGGNNNIYIGYKAGYSNTSVSNSIILGHNLTSSGSSTLNIGGVLYGNLLTGTIGISRTTQEAALDVVSTGSNQFAQIWRDSTDLIKSSMSATGIMMASKFIGDGSGLTGVTASGAVQKTGDAMTGPLTLAGSSLTVTAQGLFKSSDTNHTTYEGLRILNTNPSGGKITKSRLLLEASNSTAVTAKGAIDVSENTSIDDDKSKMEFLTDEGAGIGLTSKMSISGTGAVTVTGNVFSVANGNVGIGNTSPSARLDVSGGVSVSGDVVSSGTFRGNGASLTALNASNLASGTVADGRLSSNVDLLNANQTITGAKTFTSTVALPTRNNISFSNELHNSSSTLLTAGYSFTNTAFTTCVTGSTLTITTNGGRVMAGFSGVVNNNTVGAIVFLSLKLDGSSIYGTNAAVGMPETNVSFIKNASFTVLTNALSSGVHTFCLDARVTGGTGGLHGDGYATTAQFWVQELR